MSTTYAQCQTTAQKKDSSSASSVLDASSQSESLQRKADMANAATQRAEAPRPNNTGMPDNLKSGIESLSGFSMDDVRVHYNSPKPATVQALAYTQGTDIHVAPGQEKHLPHEAWHVAQQMAGRVSPTTNINGMPVNDNAALEHEADVMGEMAVQCKGAERRISDEHSGLNNVLSNSRVMQQLKYYPGSDIIQNLGQLRRQVQSNQLFFDDNDTKIKVNRGYLDAYIALGDDTIISGCSDNASLIRTLNAELAALSPFVENGVLRNRLSDARLKTAKQDLNEFINNIPTVHAYKPTDEGLYWRLDNQDGGGNFQIQLNGVPGASTIACVYIENGTVVSLEHFRQALRDSYTYRRVYRAGGRLRPV